VSRPVDWLIGLPGRAWRSPGLRRAAIPALLFVVSFGAVVSAQRHQGVVRDETVYIDAGARYAGWWVRAHDGESVFSHKAITAAFGGAEPTANNREHPPLMKVLFGLSERIAHQNLGLTSALTGFRLPTAAVNALLVVLVFLFAASIWGRAEGVIAALLTLLLPRAFFHAGLATFDAPIAALWFAVIYAYHRALADRRWLWVLAVAFGCALATKHNAILLPVVIAAHYAVVSVRARSWRLRPGVALAVLIGGPLVFLALWPWMWFDTYSHLHDWLAFHFHHVHYNYEYLGENWNHPPYPWHVPIVTTLFTVPVVTLAAGLVGALVLAVRAWRRRSADATRAPGVLLVFSAGVAMGPFLLGSQPIFGAEKHWAAAIPSIALFAGVGLVWAARLAVDRLAAAGLLGEARLPRARPIAMVGLAALAVAAAATETIDAQPYALSHYNALAGGAPGGADLGMNRQFWGYAARGVLPFLDAEAAASPEPLKVYAHDADMTFATYQREGLLSRRIRVTAREETGITNSDLALVVHERHFNRHDFMIWSTYGTVQPVLVLRSDGVPLVSVYRRPRPPSPQ